MSTLPTSIPTPEVPSRRRQRGLSLVELMVAMVIALIATFVMFQVFSVSEGYRQTTLYGNDAQTGGTLAQYYVEREVRMAGYSLNADALRNCSSVYSYFDPNDSTTTPYAWAGTGMTGVSIIDGGGTANDSIIVRYGDSPFGAIGTQLRSTMPQSSSELNVDSVSGCTDGGFAIVTDGTNCTVMEITQVQEAALKLQHNPGQGSGPTYNPPVNYQNANGWPAFQAGDSLFCMPVLSVRQFSVANNALVLADGGVTTVLVPGIVALQAQYGISANATSDDVIDWVDATGIWATPSVANQLLIRAVRLGIVARSNQLEKTDVTASCTNTSGDVNGGPCLWTDTAADPAPTIDLSGDANWQRYRYKAFSTIVVPRNIIWRPPA